MLEGVDICKQSLPALHVGGVGVGAGEPHSPDMAVAVVSDDGGLAVSGDVGAFLQIDPQGELGAVEGRLLYV